MTDKQGDFPKTSRPALRALHGAGYFRLEQLADVSKAELGKLHGVGPKALRILEHALSDKGLSFAKMKERKQPS